MKLLLVTLMTLTSLSIFAKDVCMLRQSADSASIACNSEKFTRVGKAGAKVLQEKLIAGYEVKETTATNTFTFYLLIKE